LILLYTGLLDQPVDAMTDLWSCRLLTLTVSISAVST